MGLAEESKCDLVEDEEGEDDGSGSRERGGG